MKHWMMVSGDGRIPWFEGPFRDVDEVTGRAKTFRKLAGRNHDLHCVTLDDRGDLSADTIEGDEIVAYRVVPTCPTTVLSLEEARLVSMFLAGNACPDHFTSEEFHATRKLQRRLADWVRSQ